MTIGRHFSGRRSSGLHLRLGGIDVAVCIRHGVSPSELVCGFLGVALTLGRGSGLPLGPARQHFRTFVLAVQIRAWDPPQIRMVAVSLRIYGYALGPVGGGRESPCLGPGGQPCRERIAGRGDARLTRGDGRADADRAAGGDA